MTSPVSGGFQFTPAQGLLDTTSYPSQPASETAARQQFMDLYWQIMNEMNAPTASAAAYAQYNKLINGNFDVWQRGTSFSGTNNYTADRWCYVSDGSGQVSTVSQQAFTPGQGVVPNEPKYFLRVAVTTAATGQSVNSIVQRVESVRSFANGKATISFWAKADTNRSVTSRIFQNFGSGGSTAVFCAGATHNLTTSWQKFTVTITLPSINGKTIGTNDFLSVEFLLPTGTVMTIDLAQVGMNAGDTALPFQPRSFVEELALCQRYYEKSYSFGINPGTVTLTNCQVSLSSTTFLLARFDTQFKIRKRIAPTIAVYSTQNGTSGNTSEHDAGGIFVTDRAVSVGAQGDTSFWISSASGTFTPNNYQRWHWTADAEL